MRRELTRLAGGSRSSADARIHAPQVHGVEYTFGGGVSGSGIFSHAPRRPPGGSAPSSGGLPSGPLPFRAAVDMGVCEATSAEVARVIESMRAEWRAADYNIMTRNCNSFAEEVRGVWKGGGGVVVRRGRTRTTGTTITIAGM